MIRLFEPLPTNSKNVSTVSALEVSSAIRRRQRMGDISLSDATQALSALEAELKDVSECQPVPEIIDEAKRLIERHPLRALDSLQLATGIVESHRRFAKQMIFITADKTLLAAAEAEGLRVWNPLLP